MTGLGAVLVIAWTTWLAAVRSRTLWLGVLFAVLLVGLSVAAASVSLWERTRLIIDVGLASASALGAVMAVALSITAFAGELRQRTAYPLLARPVARWAFVAGKLAGVVAVMSIVALVMHAGSALTVTVYGGELPAAFWASVPLSLAEMMVVCAIAVAFSTLTEAPLAAGFSAATVIAGNLSGDVLRLAARVARDGDTLGATVLELVYRVLPDLGRLSLRAQAANGLAVPEGAILWGCVYAASYTLAVLAVAALIFTRRRAL